MFKRLITIFFIITVVGNSLAVIHPHRDGEGGCGAECCDAARQKGPKTTISTICCITECQGSAETTTSTVTFTVLKQQQLTAPGDFTSALSTQSSYLEYAGFPISPTRFLHGSSSRYLDPGSLLI